MSAELTPEQAVGLWRRSQKSASKQRKGLAYILRRMWFYRYVYLLMLPGLLYFLIFEYLPMWGIVIAFFDYRPWLGLLNSPFVGLDNFRTFFESIYFVRLMRNTLLISFLNLVLYFPAPIILALLLNEVRHTLYKRVIQTVSYLPHFISWVVVGGLLTYMFSVNVGFLTQLLSRVGLPPIQVLGSESAFYPLVIGSTIWKEVGWGAIIYLAAIAGINLELYEAATIDGANRLQRVLYVTLPGIIPVALVMLILRLGNILTVNYLQIMILIGGDASLLEVGDVIQYWVYRVGFFQQNFGIATAVGLFLSVIGLVLVWGANRISHKLTDTGLW
jgi:putative aldouronate transport system permease protein